MKVRRSSAGWARHFERRLALYQRVATGHLFTVASRKVGSVHEPVELICPFKHRFALSGRDLLRGIGCPQCRAAAQAGFRLRQLEDAKGLAKERAGRCLADTYHNARTPIPWQCHKGHIWESTLDNVRRGHWCFFCARGSARPGRRRRPGR